MEKLLCQRTRWVWSSGWEVRWTEHRAVRCWWSRVVRLSACSLVDQIREEKVAIAELVRLGRLDLLVLWCCIRGGVGIRRMVLLLRLWEGLANHVDRGCRPLGPGVVD